MKKQRMCEFIAAIFVLVMVLGLPQGYATHNLVSHPGPMQVSIFKVLDPSVSCVNLGLADQLGLGSVQIKTGSLSIALQNASPDSTYGVSVGYKNSGGCDGTWQSLGQINTNHSGDGVLTQSITLASGHQYIFELRDSSGNPVYATTFVKL